jgi:hypothetical protein
MTSILKVDTIQDQAGNNIINESSDTITIGASGDTISIPSGATLSSTDPLVFPAGTVSAPAITTSGDTNTGIFFPSADTIAFTEGGAEAMRITSDKRLGIKTTTPETELDISSGATTGGTKRYITLTSLNGSSSEIGYADIGVTFNQNSAGNESGGMNFRCFHDGTIRDRYLFGAGSGDGHIWYTGASTERMRITSGGELCVGVSVALGPAMINSYSTTSGTACFSNLNSAGAGSNYHYFINSTNSAIIGSITNNGNTGTAFNTSSDYRLKENVNYNFDATTRLKQLKPARFNFIRKSK